MSAIPASSARASLATSSLTALIVGLALIAVLSIIVTVGVGAVSIPADKVVAIIRHAIQPSDITPYWTKGQSSIVLDLRIPRAIVGATVGAGLAIVGCVLQTITRNPLADPYLFGVSSGAAVGAVIVILYTGAVFGLLTLPLAAFAGALTSMALVFLLARESGGFTTERLILTGVAVHFVLMATTNVLIFNATDRGAEAALFWMLGSFGNARWNVILPPIVALIIGCAWVLTRAGALDALSLGEEGAHTLGVDVPRSRTEMFLVAALMTGVFVSVSGAVGFIGLIIPHCARWIAGAQMRRCVPVAALIGAKRLPELTVLMPRPLLAPA